LAGERRQVTVLFADISGFTALAETMDPEDVRQMMNACFARLVPLVEDYGGTIDKFIGDEIMALFGAPIAHDNDAERAVRTALAMMEVLHAFNAEQETTLGLHCGINTGMVIAGGIGTPARQDYSVMGDAVNLAARLGDASERGQIFVGLETYRLTTALFTFERLEPMRVKGKAEPVQVYCVLGLRDIQSCPDVGGPLGRVPLVGRDAEVTLLLDLWDQVKEGRGQVVVLTGEPGIGKSRLVQEVQEQVAGEPSLRWECRCSPYYQNTAMYPIIGLLEQVCHFQPGETPMEQVAKLERTLGQYRLLLEETIPLCTLLLALPLPEDRYVPLSLSPQRQRRKTMELVLELVVRHTTQHPVLFIIEDVQWSDPSTLEFLDLLIAQAPTAAIFTLLTCRPEVQAPWGLRSYITPLVLQRLRQAQVETMVEWITHGKPIPPTIRQHIVTQTDGIPLFVDELTKGVLESDILIEGQDGYAVRGPMPMAIPATLQGTLMARLDRVGTAKGIAQLGATMGRQFSYTLLKAIAPVEEATLQRELRRLVDAELLYQRGLPSQATYLFKHALIRDAAYASLLKSTRQQYHHRIAKALEQHLPDTVERQPELVAQHYTEAGLVAQAIPYWQQAGQRASARSANVEAISHLTTALALLKILPDAPERRQQELTLLTALGTPLVLTKGHAAPEVEAPYARARELCQQLDDTPQLFSTLLGLRRYHHHRGELSTAHELGEQLLRLAERLDDSGLVVRAHHMHAEVLVWLGEFARARAHAEQGIARHDPQQHHTQVFRYGNDSGVGCRAFGALALWVLGYPDQAQQQIDEAVALAQELPHPFNLVFAFMQAVYCHRLRREGGLTQTWAEAALTMATEQGFVVFIALGLIHRGWALAAQGRPLDGLVQIRQGLDAWQATGAYTRPYYLALLAGVYGQVGQIEEGLRALTEALTAVEVTGERFMEAELYRLKGELWLARSSEHPLAAETCFQQALAVAGRQQAKSFELRTAMSLSHLWQHQGKRAAAHELLAPIYDWFTEGFDTADLQEAKALLEELA
jgi:class 3 adenylate cyclase/predicted ATPase